MTDSPSTPEAAPPAWAPYEPDEGAPWDLRRVVHLHRRAAFAAPWNALQRDLRDGPKAAIDRLLNPPRDEAFERLAATIGDAATASGNPGRLQAWWVFRMLNANDPLRERLTLMWHNHFATSNRKVDNLVWMRKQNELFRKHARAPFGDLLRAIVQDPAMLTWLDADSNRKGKPNENLARELMELFTLGVDNYTERDVKEAARALTGWSVTNGEFAFREKRHDNSEKSILDASGPFTGDDLLGVLLAQRSTASRVAWRLCDLLMGDDALDDAARDELAAGLAARQLDIDWGVATILHSQRFFSDANIRSRIISPTQHVIGALVALELQDPPPSTLVLAEWIAQTGQELFYPPNVGGWRGGKAWLGGRSLVARANFGHALESGSFWRGSPPNGLAPRDRDHSLPALLWGEELGPLSERLSIGDALARPEQLLG